MEDLTRRALAVNQAFLALGVEEFHADGATFKRDRSLQNIHDANHVTHISASTAEEIDLLLARVEREFEGFPHRRFDLDFTTPPAFAARLAHEGYERMDMLVMVLEGALMGEATSHDIRLVDSDEGWRAYEALHEADWNLYNEMLPISVGNWSAEEMYRSRRMKSPPARFWLAYVDGEPRSYLASWEGIDGVGQVDDLFTHPDYRHRGLATALIHRCVADCRERDAGPVVIVADPDGTPKNMYAAMGFRPIALKRTFSKVLAVEKDADRT